ncbi:unnamed protein product, partial [Amoebophrya sp. A25]
EKAVLSGKFGFSECRTVLIDSLLYSKDASLVRLRWLRPERSIPGEQAKVQVEVDASRKNITIAESQKPFRQNRFYPHPETDPAVFKADNQVFDWYLCKRLLRTFGLLEYYRKSEEKTEANTRNTTPGYRARLGYLGVVGRGTSHARSFAKNVASGTSAPGEKNDAYLHGKFLHEGGRGFVVGNDRLASLKTLAQRVVEMKMLAEDNRHGGEEEQVGEPSSEYASSNDESVEDPSSDFTVDWRSDQLVSYVPVLKKTAQGGQRSLLLEEKEKCDADGLLDRASAARSAQRTQTLATGTAKPKPTTPPQITTGEKRKGRIRIERTRTVDHTHLVFTTKLQTIEALRELLLELIALRLLWEHEAGAEQKGRRKRGSAIVSYLARKHKVKVKSSDPVEMSDDRSHEDQNREDSTSPFAPEATRSTKTHLNLSIYFITTATFVTQYGKEEEIEDLFRDLDLLTFGNPSSGVSNEHEGEHGVGCQYATGSTDDDTNDDVDDDSPSSTQFHPCPNSVVLDHRGPASASTGRTRIVVPQPRLRVIMSRADPIEHNLLANHLKLRTGPG